MVLFFQDYSLKKEKDLYKIHNFFLNVILIILRHLIDDQKILQK